MPSSSIEIEVKKKDAFRLNPRIGKASIRADQLLTNCGGRPGKVLFNGMRKKLTMYNRLPPGLVQREANENRNHLDSAQAEITQRTYCVGDASEYDLFGCIDLLQCVIKTNERFDSIVTCLTYTFL